MHTVRERVQRIFAEYGPMTDECLLTHYRLKYGWSTGSTVRTRRSELVRDGVLRATALKDEVIATGRSATVWAEALTGTEWSVAR